MSKRIKNKNKKKYLNYGAYWIRSYLYLCDKELSHEEALNKVKELNKEYDLNNIIQYYLEKTRMKEMELFNELLNPEKYQHYIMEDEDL